MLSIVVTGRGCAARGGTGYKSNEICYLSGRGRTAGGGTG